MVEFYVRMIKAGELTLDQVPDKWREAVQAALGREG